MDLPHYLAYLLEFAERRGISRSQLISDQLLTERQAVLAEAIGNQAFALLEFEIHHRIGNPQSGLDFVESMPLSVLGNAGSVMIASSNLRELIENLLSYHRLVVPQWRFHLQEHADGSATLRCDPPQVMPAHLRTICIEMMLNIWRNVSLFVLARVPVGVEWLFEFPEPTHSARHRHLFGNKVSYDRDMNGIYVSAADLFEPLHTACATTLCVSQNICRDTLEQVELGRSLAGSVRRLLLKQGPDLSASDIASALHMSERTLRRRLSDEKVSFQQILDDIRSTLAEQYLKETTLGLSQIAEHLGFSDLSSFRKFCKRRFDPLPDQYRPD
ncbi:MAG: AraC family transcriptional regulator ligand-binding domain-containing protein [Pseudomonadales bacterium]|nr:AraC family transcriptional regulator ligand-binding domain-containing protein [Pseudomonadales bacterium]